MGVRRDDTALRAALDDLIARRGDDMRHILRAYGVPTPMTVKGGAAYAFCAGVGRLQWSAASWRNRRRRRRQSSRRLARFRVRRRLPAHPRILRR
jgi:hypothetical protein